MLFKNVLLMNPVRSGPHKEIIFLFISRQHPLLGTDQIGECPQVRPKKPLSPIPFSGRLIASVRSVAIGPINPIYFNCYFNSNQSTLIHPECLCVSLPCLFLNSICSQRAKVLILRSLKFPKASRCLLTAALN